MIIFGVRAPLVVDYEIAAQRRGTPVMLGISLDGHPRTMFTSRIVDLADVADTDLGPVLPCAFSPERRAGLAQRAVARGFTLADSLIDPTAILPPGFRMDAAGFINAAVVVGGGCFFGEGVLVNRSASLGHHVVLGDWVSIGPGAVVSGNIRIGARSMIGAGAVLQSDIRIGSNVLVAAGSVVRKSVPDNHLVWGNPARSVPRPPVPSTLGRRGDE
jgi:UDP-3-O-[3-hydroxymyristoyl] glucosamine N-acyltransferase